MAMLDKHSVLHVLRDFMRSLFGCMTLDAQDCPHQELR